MVRISFGNALTASPDWLTGSPASGVASLVLSTFYMQHV
jgi:hypothetical protein